MSNKPFKCDYNRQMWFYDLVKFKYGSVVTRDMDNRYSGL